MWLRSKLLSMLAAAVSVAATGGCSPGAFDELAAKTPVQVVPRPGEFGAQSFGASFLSMLGRPYDADAAGLILVSGVEHLALAVVAISPDGGAHVRPLAQSDLAELRSAPVTSMAELRDGATGRVLLGAPTATRGSGTGITRILTFGGSTLMASLAAGPGPADAQTGFGSAVATGTVGAGNVRDVVVTSDRDVNLFEDGALASPVQTHQPAPASCAVALDPALEQTLRRSRALVVDNISTAAGDEIVVGVPRPTGDGVVQVMIKTTSAGKAELGCGFSLSPPSGSYQGRAKFGASLATGDFNKDGQRDLLVGAPPDRAFVYLGPVTAATVPVVLSPSEGTPAAAFGAAVAAINLDGQGGDEALVSDARRVVDGAADAGELSIFAFGQTAQTTVVRLHAQGSPADLRLGLGLQPTRFCNSVPEVPCADGQPLQRLLVAGTATSLYIYFELASPQVTDLRRRGDVSDAGDARVGVPDGGTDVRDAAAEVRDAASDPKSG